MRVVLVCTSRLQIHRKLSIEGAYKISGRWTDLALRPERQGLLNFLSCRLVEFLRVLTSDKLALCKHVDHFDLSTVQIRHPPKRTDMKLRNVMLTSLDGEKQESNDEGQEFIIRIRHKMAP